MCRKPKNGFFLENAERVAPFDVLRRFIVSLCPSVLANSCFLSLPLKMSGNQSHLGTSSEASGPSGGCYCLAVFYDILYPQGFQREAPLCMDTACIKITWKKGYVFFGPCVCFFILLLNDLVVVDTLFRWDSRSTLHIGRVNKNRTRLGKSHVLEFFVVVILC